MTHLTPGAVVQRASGLAGELHLDGVAAAGAALTIAPIHGETTGEFRHGDSIDVLHIGAQHARRGVDDLHAVAGQQ